MKTAAEPGSWAARHETLRQELIEVSLGRRFADVAIVHGNVVNVHIGRILRQGIAIAGTRIAAVGDIAYSIGPNTHVIDATDRYVCPGLLAPHIHQWSSHHNGTAFAQCLLCTGTTTMADGFYGPGIVAGTRGVRFFLDEIRQTPVKVLFLAPASSYVQNRAAGLPPAPNSVTAQDLLAMLEWPECVGIEETDPTLLITDGHVDSSLQAVIQRALDLRLVPTGHGAPSFTDSELNAWVASGILNNHEIFSARDATRQAELGLHVLLRQAPTLENIRLAVRGITEERYDSRAFQITPDLVPPDEIELGQQDVAIRTAIAQGLNPIQAIQMATIQPAEFFRVNHDVGSLAPGRFADVLILDDLVNFGINQVMANGSLVVSDGHMLDQLDSPHYPSWLYESIAIKERLRADDFRVVSSNTSATKVRVIAFRDDSFHTDEEVVELATVDGAVSVDAARGINLVAVIDRLSGQQAMTVGFVAGFRLAAGAIGACSEPLGQSIVVVGATAQDLASAANAILDLRGAFVAVREGKELASFPTPLLGLASDLPYEMALPQIKQLLSAWRELGCTLAHPLLRLNAIAASTEPVLRISAHGLTRTQTGSEVEVVPVVIC